MFKKIFSRQLSALHRRHLAILSVALIVLAAGLGCEENENVVEAVNPPSTSEDIHRSSSGENDAEASTAFEVVAGSTQKICQLTGEYDYQKAAEAGVAPTEFPTLNRTFSNYGFHGTDLGASFEHDGKLWFLFGDTFSTETIPFDPVDGTSNSAPNPMAADATAFTTDEDPTDCVSLEFLAHPTNPNIWMYPSFEIDGVQEEGISNGESMYVWYSQGSPSTLYLARSDDHAQSFHTLHAVSTNRFIGVSVDLIPNLLVPGLEEVGEIDWLFIFGIGPEYRGSDLFLAAVPFDLIEDPLALVYFAGLDEANLPTWSEIEDEAQPVIDIDNPLATGDWFAGIPLEEKANTEGCIGEFSVHYSEVAESWITMYNCDFLSIEMHNADFAWGPWSPAKTVFDPASDGGYCGFMHLTEDFSHFLDLNCEYNLTTPGRVDPGSPYGPYIMERYTSGDRNRVQLYFVMSTWHPYNTVVMTTELQQVSDP